MREVVGAYISCYRKMAQAEHSYYRSASSLREVIWLAATARTIDGKKHDHQSRSPLPVLEEAAKCLGRIVHRIEACQTFSKLYNTVEEAILPIHGIGNLTVYDTALRIGAKLNLFPEEVYLHRGTREGATALGLDAGGKSISPAVLPHELSRLEPYEIEDCLCIYKGDLKRIRRASAHKA